MGNDTPLSLYEEGLMEEWLSVVGMRLFAEQYFELKCGRGDFSAYSEKSAKNRRIAVAAIFQNGYHLAALRKIAASKSVPASVALLADATYTIETR
ncbi:MAG: hypothetical protein IKM34_04955 [Clostridia bacterium]|nr:hypothetical protein [Clostridia bacterium]